MGIKVLSQQESESMSIQNEIRNTHLRLLKPDFYKEKTRERHYSKKRAVDLVLGSIGFLVFMLIYPIVALIIKVSSPGPVFFKQERIGLNGEIFECYKFRTMHTVEKQEKNGQPVVTQKDDKRIFKFGNFMRRYNIDEIPQIMNV